MEFSPFKALIDTNAFFQIKASYIAYDGDTYEFKALIRVRSDYRWHWVNDNYYDLNDAITILNDLILLHIKNFPEHSLYLEKEQEKLLLTDEIQENGFTFFNEDLS